MMMMMNFVPLQTKHELFNSLHVGARVWKMFFEMPSVIVKMQKSDCSTFHIQSNSLKTCPVKKSSPPVMSRHKAPNISQLLFIITNKCTMNIITVYITTVSVCNLYSYLFQHFHVTIRQFTTNVLLSYIWFLNSSCWKYNL